jgi:hypothetical protein
VKEEDMGSNIADVIHSDELQEMVAEDEVIIRRLTEKARAEAQARIDRDSIPARITDVSFSPDTFSVTVSMEWQGA